MSGQKTISTVTPAIGAIKIQQSTYGLVVPIVWGRSRITGNLLWYGDFKATPHTEVTQSGGKGGGAPRQTTTTYTYSASVAMALCHGPIRGIRTSWRGKKIYNGTPYNDVVQIAQQNTPFSGMPIDVNFTAGWSDVSVARVLAFDSQEDYAYYRKGQLKPLVRGVDYTAVAGRYTFAAESVTRGEYVQIRYTFSTSGLEISSLHELGMDLFRGLPAQAPWSYLTTHHASEALGYSGLAYVAAANYALDDGATVENHSFEVDSLFSFSTTIPDANPAPIVVDALSNQEYGARFGVEKIGPMTDYAAACTAQGIFLSPALTEQTSAADFLSTMATLTNVGIVWSGGLLKFVPYADTPLTGNGVTFTPNTAPIYDLTDDDFQPTDDLGPVKVNRGAVGDTFNQVNVEFLDRANAYNIGIMPANDQADIQENGLRPMPTVQAHWITEASVAKIVATLMLQRSMSVRNTYEFKLGWTKIAIEPMDLVTLTDPGLLMSKVPVRILTIEEDDAGYLDVVAEDFPQGSASATLYPTASGAGFQHDYNELPGTLGAPVIFEAPSALATQEGGLEIWLAAGTIEETYGGCEVWVSLTGANFERAAVLHGASRFGTTTSPLAATVGTTEETVGVVLTAGGQLLTGTVADMNALSTLCYIDGEFIGYETSTLTGGSAYTLGNHMLRGAYLSAAVSHAVGSQFVRCDEALARMPLSPDYIGKTLHIKVLPFNRYGGGIGDLASATEYTYTVTGAQANNPPVAPAGLAVEGAFTISTAKFKWNRVGNAATYNVQIFHGATKVREVNVGDALRFDYSAFDAKVDGGPWRELTIKVQGIHTNGAPGAFAALTVLNPQVGGLTGIRAEGSTKSVQFSCSRPTDPDFYGIMICMSTVSGFTPGAESMVYDGPNTSLTINSLAGVAVGSLSGLAFRSTRRGGMLVFGETIYRAVISPGQPLVNGVTYYIRAAAYDTFDRVGMTWSTEFAVTPTEVDIPDDSITLDKLVKALQSRIKLIDDPVTVEGSVQARVKAETDARISAIQTEVDSRIAAILAESGARTTYVQSYTFSKAETQSALSIQATAQAAYTDVKKGEAIAAAAADIRNYSYSKTDVDSAESAQSSVLTAGYTAYADARKAEAISVSAADVRSYGYGKADSDSAIASLATTLRAEFASSAGASTAYVQNYAYSKSAIDAAEAAQSSSLTAGYRAYGDAGKAEAISAAAADVRSFTYSRAALDGAFSSQSNAISATYTYADTKKAEAIGAAAADANSKKAEAIAASAADVRSYAYSKAAADASEAAQTTSLTAGYTTYGDAKKAEAITASAADVRNYGYAKATVDNAIATSINQVSARLDNVGGVTIEQKFTAQANVNSGLSAQLTFKIDNNGSVTGYGLASESVNGVPQSAFAILADRFLVVGPSGPTAMFSVSSGTVGFSGELKGPFGSIGRIDLAADGHIKTENSTGWGYWPSAGAGTVAYFGPQGIQVGNYNDGRFFHLYANGDFYTPFLAMTSAGAVFGGTLSAPRVVTNGNMAIDGAGTVDIFSSGLPAPGYPGLIFIVSRPSKVLITAAFGNDNSEVVLFTASAELQRTRGNAGQNGIIGRNLDPGTYYLTCGAGSVTYAHVLKVV